RIIEAAKLLGVRRKHFHFREPPAAGRGLGGMLALLPVDEEGDERAEAGAPDAEQHPAQGSSVRERTPAAHQLAAIESRRDRSLAQARKIDAADRPVIEA